MRTRILVLAFSIAGTAILGLAWCLVATDEPLGSPRQRWALEGFRINDALRPRLVEKYLDRETLEWTFRVTSLEAVEDLASSGNLLSPGPGFVVQGKPMPRSPRGSKYILIFENQRVGCTVHAVRGYSEFAPTVTLYAFCLSDSAPG